MRLFRDLCLALLTVWVAGPVLAQPFTALERNAVIDELVDAQCQVATAELDRLAALSAPSGDERNRAWTLVALRNRGLLTPAGDLHRLVPSLCTPELVPVRDRLIDGFSFFGCTVSPGDLLGFLAVLDLPQEVGLATLAEMHARLETRMDVTERGLILAERLCPAQVRELVDRAEDVMRRQLASAAGCEGDLRDLQAAVLAVAPGDSLLANAAARRLELPARGRTIAHIDYEARRATLFSMGCNEDQLAQRLAPSGRIEALVAAMQPFNCRVTLLDRPAIEAASGLSDREASLGLNLMRMTGRLTGLPRTMEVLAPEFCTPEAQVPPSLREGVDPEQHVALMAMFRARECVLDATQLHEQGAEFGVRFVQDLDSARGALMAMMVADEVTLVAGRYALDQALCDALPTARAAVIEAFRSGNCALTETQTRQLLTEAAQQEELAALLDARQVVLRGGQLVLEPALCDAAAADPGKN